MEPDDDEAEFLGFHHHSMDTKGRLVLPAPHRKLLEEGLVMTIGFENCLTVHTLDDWKVVRASLRSLQTNDRQQRQFARMIASHAERTTLDKQGRVTIPQRLRQYAQLSKDCTVVGAEKHAEIWDAERWEDYSRRSLEDIADTDTTFNIGIF